MKNNIVWTVLCSLLSFTGFSQQDPNVLYDHYIHIADSLYDAKEYKIAALNYSKAFESLGWKGTGHDRYNAACTWALAGNADSAFYQLYNLAEKRNYSNYNWITNDKDLLSLKTDARWEPLLLKVKANKDFIEKDFDRPLVAQLDSILNDDQKYRHQLDSIETLYGWESPQMNEHWRLINEKDSLNLIKVRNILDTRGWLGPNIIGGSGNSTLFLVIQHSDLKVQKKYLPMMRDAVKKGNAFPNDLALLEDRVALGLGKKQVYGSQIGRHPETGEMYVLPLKDPENVDERRASVGLPTLGEYTQYFGFKWDLEEYKKNLPLYAKMNKK